MKRKVIGALILALALNSMAACGDKSQTNGSEAVQSQSSESAKEEKLEVNESLNALEASASIEETEGAENNEMIAGSTKDDSSGALFTAFINGEEKVNIAGNDGEYTFEDMVVAMCHSLASDDRTIDIESVKYTYIDCGAAGNQELVIWVEASEDYDNIVQYHIIKNENGKLVLWDTIDRLFGENLEFMNSYGKLCGSYAAGAGFLAMEEMYYDKNVELNSCFTEYVMYDAAKNVEGAVFEAFEGCDEDVSDIFLRELIVGEEKYYCGEKREDEASNGVDFEENARILKKVFDKAGEKLYSLEEIDEIIANREKQLGITEEMKKYEELTWEECEKKESWKKIGENSSSIPDANFLSPSKELDLKYASEKSFKDFSCYKLEAQGSKEKAVISEIKNELARMVQGYEKAAANDDDVLDYFYGENTTQTVFTDLDGESRIIESNAITGTPELDEIMKKVGYDNYEITYYYTFGDYRNFEDEYNEPAYVKLIIEDKEYDYMFFEQELLIRYEGGKSTENPKVNDFIQSIYKYGVYLGEYINAVKDEYSLFMKGHSDVYYNDAEDEFVIVSGIQGLSDNYKFILDEDTVFAQDCECQFFDGYVEGDTPYTWAKRVYENEEEYPLGFSGIFVIHAADEHLDELVGCYWWD